MYGWLAELKDEIISKVQSIGVKFESYEPKYLCKKDVAKIFNVDPRTVDNWVQAGVVKAYHIGGLLVFKENEILTAPKLIIKASKYKTDSHVANK